MKLSPYRKKKIDRMKRNAVLLYKQGMSIDEVRNALENMGFKRSRAWVGFAVSDKKLSTGKVTRQK